MHSLVAEGRSVKAAAAAKRDNAAADRTNPPVRAANYPGAQRRLNPLPPLALKLPARRAVNTATPRPVSGDPRPFLPFAACWRSAVLLGAGYLGVRHLADPAYFSLFSGVTFGAHEFGHLAFAPFGEVLAVGGGSLMQLLVPVGAAVLLAGRRDGFGVVFAACWLSVSLVDLARYVGDARALELPLVSMSPDGGDHDWNWLLDHYNLLRYDLRIATALRRLAAVILLVALTAGAWICIRLFGRPAAVAPSSEPA